MRYVVKLWMAWAGWKDQWKNLIFTFLYCFCPKQWEKVVPKVKFLVWEESTFLGQSTADLHRNDPHLKSHHFAVIVWSKQSNTKVTNIASKKSYNTAGETVLLEDRWNNKNWALKVNLAIKNTLIVLMRIVVKRGPWDYLDTRAFDIFGKSVHMRNFKKWY